ncbi:MAG: ribosome maturation factor RimP [Arcobacter sp.]|nr:ribosome maturation factor RimP [Arcobacter sp.]
MNLEESIKLAVESLGVQLYDTSIVKENDNTIFRVFITSKDGINLDKCAEVSRMISPILDVEEPLNGNYNLEVSSPGIERKLKKNQHFISSIGEKVKVKDINTDVYKGELKFANEDKIIIDTKDGEKELAYSSILSASTYFEW